MRGPYPPDDVHVAWEGYLDVEAFSIRIPRQDISGMMTQLRAIPPERVAALRAAGGRVWHRLAWLGYFTAERSRQGLANVPVSSCHLSRFVPDPT